MRGHNRRVQKGSAILHGEMDAFENAGRQPASLPACTASRSCTRRSRRRDARCFMGMANQDPAFVAATGNRTNVPVRILAVTPGGGFAVVE